MAPWSFRLLGELEVTDGTRTAPVGGGKLRVVLATLLLRANQTVSVADLVDRLWDDQVPSGARATVQAIHQQGGVAVAAHPFWRTERQARGSRVYGVGWDAVELDFDAIEVENSTPGFYLFNQMAHRACDSARRTELGNSDAHILDAIGRAYTTFPGRTPVDLRLAIEQATTRAHRTPYEAVGLLRYVAWGLERRRQRRVGEAAAGG